MNRERLEEGVHEGWLTLKEDERSYALPYIIVNRGRSAQNGRL